MSEIADLLACLARRNITVSFKKLPPSTAESTLPFQILITNLAHYFKGLPTIGSTQTSTRSYSSKSSSSSSSSEGSKTSIQVSIKPAIGVFWESVAHHRILVDFLDFPHNFSEDTNERQVSLLKSKIAGPSESLIVKITESGIS
jgi:hypothetical protein